MEECPCSADYFVTAAEETAPVVWSPPEAEATWTETEPVVPAMTRSIYPATPAQITLLTSLVAERDATVPQVAAAANALTVGMTKSVASKLITELTALPKTKTFAGAKIRSNNYAGECEICGGTVEERAGRIEKIDGKWKTFHLDGKCLTVEEATAAAALRVSEPGVYKHDGVYYRVRRGKWDKETFWAEKIHLSSTEVSFSRAGRATFLKASERLSWKEARDAGVAVNACINCGRHLDLPQSVVAGYGKDCSETCGWPYPGAKLAKAVLAGEATWEGI